MRAKEGGPPASAKQFFDRLAHPVTGRIERAFLDFISESGKVSHCSAWHWSSPGRSLHKCVLRCCHPAPPFYAQAWRPKTHEASCSTAITEI